GFVDSVTRLLPDARVRDLGGGMTEVAHRGRVTRVGAFPIGVDARTVAARAQSSSVGRRLKELRRELGDRDVVLGVDRLDYPKGIPERRPAFRARVALVTPLCDGMNLVAKEYCACQDGGGALVLSEFAGAAVQLGPWALTVNPYDADATAEALQRALTMDASERKRRMRALRDAV